MKYKMVPKYDISEVEITLLTIEEAKNIPAYILAAGCWWWLRSPGNYQNFAAYINHDGVVLEYGNYVYRSNGTVRPAFKIANLESPILNKIIVGKTWCTVVAPGLALADKPFCNRRFDANNNDWESSELKAFIESDGFRRML